MASLYSLYVIVVVEVLHSQALDRMGLTIGQVVGSYYLGGVIGGLIYGLLYPLTRFGLGAGLTGYLIALPFFYLLSYEIDTEPSARPFVVLVSSVVGAFAGLWIWHDARPEPWCPSSRTTRVWWAAAAVGMPLAWYVGVVWRPSRWAVVLATAVCFILAVAVIIVTLMRKRASPELQRRADSPRLASARK